MAQQPNQEVPKRWPLVVTPSNRDNTTTRDARLVNAYLEKYHEGYRIIKRPGMVAVGTYSTTAGVGQGIGNSQGVIYTIVGGVLYYNGVAGFTDNVQETTAPCRILAIQGATLGSFPIIVNSVNLYYIHKASYFPFHLTLYTVSLPANPDSAPGYPTGGNAAYLDGTLYFLSYGGLGAPVYGSNVGDITTWNALNYIYAQAEGDVGITIAKQLVYVIVFKQWTTEVFYDAGNATGSPLSPVPGALIMRGCADARTVLDIDGILFWVSTTRDGSAEISMLENLAVKTVSDAPVEKLLLQTAFTTVYTWCYKGGGHTFYVLTLVDINITLAYDLKEQTWAQWTDVNGNYMPICSSTFLGTQCLLQHISNGKVYSMDPTVFTDDGAIITVDIYTPNFDGGVDRTKMLTRMRFNGDQTPGSVLQVRCNDNDYNPVKWTQYRRVDMGITRPFLTSCGSFYRRSYHIRHACNTPLRLSSVDLDIALGTL